MLRPNAERACDAGSDSIIRLLHFAGVLRCRVFPVVHELCTEGLTGLYGGLRLRRPAPERVPTQSAAPQPSPYRKQDLANSGLTPFQRAWVKSCHLPISAFLRLPTQTGYQGWSCDFPIADGTIDMLRCLLRSKPKLLLLQISDICTCRNFAQHSLEPPCRVGIEAIHSSLYYDFSNARYFMAQRVASFESRELGRPK